SMMNAITQCEGQRWTRTNTWLIRYRSPQARERPCFHRPFGLTDVADTAAAACTNGAADGAAQSNCSPVTGSTRPFAISSCCPTSICSINQAQSP
ncbi:hypothetical protein LSAT2_004604, partial [Lamellibrachia satsuma]